MGKLVLFREALQSNIVKKARELEGLNAEQILEMFQHKDLILFVTTPFFSEPIDKYAIPLELYPEVKFTAKHKEKDETFFESDLPSSYFCFKELTFPRQISLFVLSEVKDAQIPPFEVIVDLDSVFDGNDLFNLIDHSLTMEHSNASTKSFDLKDSAKSIISNARTTNILFNFTLSDSSYKLIKKRISVLQEVQETEQNYLHDIHILIEFWEPTIRQLRLFNESELTQIFKDFPTIYKCHLVFLHTLKEHGCEFSTMVGDIFLEFSDYFKLSLPYISNYHNIIQIINSRPKVLSINDVENGKDLTSYLITPVQRIPRYILFIKELLKRTPRCHPDFEELELAYTKIQKITIEMDISTKRAQQMNEIWMIQKSLTKPFSLISPNRCLKYTLNITFKSENCHLYIFNDFVMIASYDKKSQTVLFSSPLLSFHYLPCYSQMGVIVKKKIYYAVFQNEETRLKFVSDLEDLRLSQDKRSSADLSMFLWSNPFVPKFLPKLSFIDGVQVNDSYVFFGDGSIVTINMKIGAVTSSQSPFGSRYGFAVTGNSTDRIFVIGGYNRQADEYCGDVWQYEVFTSKWTNLTRGSTKSSTVSNFEFHPRCEHAVLYDDDKIYVFGGRFRRTFFNDLSIFYLTTKKWNVLNLDISPQPRSLHSMVMVNKSIIVLGGHNQQTVFNDVNVFDANTLKWKSEMVNCSTIPKRYGHRSIALQNMIVTIGGTADGETVQKPSVIYCDDRYSCRCFNCAGNYPFGEFIDGSFALFFDAGRLNLYVYNHCSIFLVQLPQEIKHAYVCNAQSELHGRLFHTAVSNPKRLSATIEEGDVFQSIQSRRRMQKFGTCYTPNSRKLNAFPRSRVRMKVDRKAIALDAAELESKEKDSEMTQMMQVKPSSFSPSSSDGSSSGDEREKVVKMIKKSEAKKSDASSSSDDEPVQVEWSRDDEKKKKEQLTPKSDTDDKSNSKSSKDTEKVRKTDTMQKHTDVTFETVESTRIPVDASSHQKQPDAENYKNAAAFGSSKIVSSRSPLELQPSLQSAISSSSSMPCFQLKAGEEVTKSSVNNTSEQCSSSIATGSPSSVSVSATESNTSLLVPNKSSDASAENVAAAILSGQSSSRPGLGAQTPSILAISKNQQQDETAVHQTQHSLQVCSSSSIELSESEESEDSNNKTMTKKIEK